MKRCGMRMWKKGRRIWYTFWDVPVDRERLAGPARTVIRPA